MNGEKCRNTKCHSESMEDAQYCHPCLKAVRDKASETRLRNGIVPRPKVAKHKRPIGLMAHHMRDLGRCQCSDCKVQRAAALVRLGPPRQVDYEQVLRGREARLRFLRENVMRKEDDTEAWEANAESIPVREPDEEPLAKVVGAK